MKTNKSISISPGNKKMGAIPSVSLPPITTCAKGVPCGKLCYAAKLCKIYPSVKNAYDRNYTILKEDPAEYWNQVRAAVSVTRFFRFHVSGDIPTADYWTDVVKTAELFPHTEILIFTKKYSIVNDYITDGGKIPGNLHVIFSEWGLLKIPNPHQLPTAAVIFKETEPANNWKICGGNCTECACAGVGCWELKKGETIAFYQH